MVIIDRNNAHHSERSGQYAIKPKHAGNVAALGADVETNEHDPVCAPSPEDFDAMRDALRPKFSRGDGVDFDSIQNLPFNLALLPDGANASKVIGPGIVKSNTMYGQGYRLSPARNACIPEALQRYDGRYELDDTDMLSAVFPKDFALANGMDAEQVRESSLDALMATRSREMENLTGLDIGRIYQRNQRKLFREALASPDAAERYCVVSASRVAPSHVEGYDWVVYEDNLVTPFRRRFFLHDSEYRSLLSDHTGPNVTYRDGQRIIDTFDVDGPRAAPESHTDLVRLNTTGALRQNGLSHVSRFAEVERETVSVGPGVVVSPRADVRGSVTLCDGAYVGRGAYIDDDGGPVAVSEELPVGDHARIRSQNHMVELWLPGDSKASMHPVERADHTIGIGITMSDSGGKYRTYAIDEPKLHERLDRLARRPDVPPERNWVTKENFAKLISDHEYWADDPSLQSIPDNFASVVDLPWDMDDGTPLHGA